MKDKRGSAKMETASELASLGVKVSDTHLTHRAKTYPFESIKHIGYYAAQTAQMSGGAVSEITSEAKCRLHVDDGYVLDFKAKSDSAFSKSRHLVEPVWLLKEVVSEATFESRLDRYEQDIASRRFFDVGKFQFHVDGSVYRRARKVLNLKETGVEVFLQPFAVVLAEEEMKRQPLSATEAAQGHLRETWGSGTQLCWTFASDSPALRCQIVSGWRIIRIP